MQKLHFVISNNYERKIGTSLTYKMLTFLMRKDLIYFHMIV